MEKNGQKEGWRGVSIDWFNSRPTAEELIMQNMDMERAMFAEQEKRDDKARTIQVGFDYKEVGLKAFDTWLGTVIWMVWKIDHITNQCFDNEIAEIVDWIEKENPITEAEFISSFHSMQVGHGVEHPSIKPRPLSGSWHNERNEEHYRKFDEFLSSVYKYWTKEEELIITIEEVG